MKDEVHLWVLMRTSGTGDVFVNSFGSLVEVMVMPDRPIFIDNDHVVAWDASLSYDLRIASGTFGFTTGEGIVNEFSGNGKVLVQTRNISDFAHVINLYLLHSSSN